MSARPVAAAGFGAAIDATDATGATARPTATVQRLLALRSARRYSVAPDMRDHPLCGALGTALLLMACAKDPEPTPAVASATAPAEATGSTTGAGATPTPGAAAPPSCEVVSEKVWSQSPGLATGMTPTRYGDGRVAIGLLLGGRPHVLVFDTEGKGEAVRVPLAGPLKDGVDKGGKRTVSRVTPGLGSGGAILAFADYHDDFPSRRRVVCGPTDSTDTLLGFDGKPLLAAEASEDEDEEAGPSAGAAKDEKKGQPPTASGDEAAPKSAATAEPPASAAAAKADESTPASAAAADKPDDQMLGSRTPPRLRPRAEPGDRQARLQELVRRRRAALARDKTGARPPGAPEVEPAASAAPPAPEPAPKPEPASKPTLASKPTPDPESAGSAGKELRTCRTFVDGGGAHAWAVGSELVAERKDDGSLEYTMVLFSSREHGRGRVTLLERKLGPSPDKLHTFDALAADEMARGRFILTSRYRGSFYALSLDAEKKLMGRAATYSDGYPTMARFARDGDATWVLASRRSRGTYELVGLRVGQGGELPDALEEVIIPGGHASKTDPTFARIGDHRFLGYVTGQLGKGAFQMVPVDDGLSPLAPSFTIAGPEEGVVDGRLFPLESGRLLTVYLKTAGGRSALVSKVLACG